MPAALASVGLLLGAPVVAVPSYEESGTIAGAPYRIRVPDNWNGTLLVYARGYTDKADDLSEGENRAPSVAPDITFAGDGAMEEPLVQAGYALAGTAYRDNGVVLEGASDLLALLRHFRSNVDRLPALVPPSRVVLVGCSLGSGFVYRLAERAPTEFDGALTLGGMGAGGRRTVDTILAFRLAYDVMFGWPEEWGQVNDVRSAGDDPQRPTELDWDQETLPVIASQSADPDNRARLEFIRLVLDWPAEGFYPGTSADPGHLPWLYVLMLLASEVSADVERRAGGPPGQNRDHNYRLTTAQLTYLRSLDSSFDPGAELATMNARANYKPDQRARAAITDGLAWRGAFDVPVMTLKRVSDGVTPPWHDWLLREDVAAAHEEDQLVQVFADGAGHCAFTLAQVLTSLSALESWIDTGTKPDSTVFSPLLGFRPGFEPSRWPFAK